MRPATPPKTRVEFRDRVDAFGDRLDARFGAFFGFPTTSETFDVVHAVRPNERFTSASLIKLFVQYVLYDRYDGRLDVLTKPHGLAAENRVAGTGLFHLLDDPDPTLEDLAMAMIAISDNAATNELIDHLGREKINTILNELGYDDTHLGRKMMVTGGGTKDLPPDISENVTSPRDVASLVADTVHEPTLSPAAYDRLRVPLRHQHDTSMVARYLPLDVDIEHKTGELTDAVLDAGTLRIEDCDPLVFAVFLDELDSPGEGTDVLASVGALVHDWLETHGENEGLAVG